MKRLTLALLTVGVLAACSHTTAPAKHADSVKAADLVCRSGYVVTSGRDSVCADPQ